MGPPILPRRQSLGEAASLIRNRPGFPLRVAGPRAAIEDDTAQHDYAAKVSTGS